MAVEITDHQRRLIDSFHRRAPHQAPELRRELVEQLVADLLSAERAELVRELEQLRGLPCSFELAAKLAELIGRARKRV